MKKINRNQSWLRDGFFEIQNSDPGESDRDFLFRDKLKKFKNKFCDFVSMGKNDFNWSVIFLIKNSKYTNKVNITASVSGFMKIGLQKWKHLRFKEFFRNFDVKTECKNEFKDNKVTICSWSLVTVSEKIDLNPLRLTSPFRQRCS